jgi:hypothetical protein
MNHELVNKQGFCTIHTCAVGQSYPQRDPNKSHCSLHTLEPLPLFYSVYGHDRFPTDNHLHPNRFLEGYMLGSKIMFSEYKCGPIQCFNVITKFQLFQKFKRSTCKESQTKRALLSQRRKVKSLY